MDKSSQKDSKNKIVNQAQPSSPGTMSDVNVVQSFKSDKKQNNESKQKRKAQKDSSKSQEKTTNDDAPKSKSKKKVKYPCLFCGEDHFSHNCPSKEYVQQFLKSGVKPPATLVNPFPLHQDQQIVVLSSNPQHQPSGLGHASREDVVFMMKFVQLQTTTRDYDSSPTKNVQSHDAPEISSNLVEHPLHIERP